MRRIEPHEVHKLSTQGRPNPARASEGHFGIVFGDQPFKVWLDGKDVSLLVDEVFAGHEGAVHFVIDPEDDDQLVDEWVTGSVHVEPRG